MSKDYYNVLGVNKTATQDEIKVAFRKAAHKYHPDKSTGDEAKFKEINEAYQVLGNEEKRRQYDQFGSTFSQNGFNGAPGQGFNSQGFNINMDDLGDIFGGFGDIFGFGKQTRKERSRRGNDIEVILPIEFTEAIFGTEKEIKIPKQVRCSSCNGSGADPDAKIETCPVCNGVGRVNRIRRTILGNMQMQSTCEKCDGEGKIVSKHCSFCHGSGIVREEAKLKIKIPAGIDNNENLRMSGQGEAGEKGGASGDLYLRIRVNSSKKFVRERYNIKSELEISFSEASLGTKRDVETVHGVVNLKIPAGTQSGKIFLLRDKGVPRLQGRGRGDHLVTIIVKVPDNLNRKQKQLLEELHEEGL
ncbi:MAG: molecular chaperone DnaJ [bacterium]